MTRYDAAMARVVDIEMGTVRPDGSVKVEQRQVRLQKYERIGVTQVHTMEALFTTTTGPPKCVVNVPQDIVQEIEAETLSNMQEQYDEAVSSIGRYKPKIIVDVLPLPKMPPRIVMWYRVANDHLPCEVCGGDTLVRCYTDVLFHTPDNSRPCHIRCGNGYAIREARAQPNRHERARRGLGRPEQPEWVTEMLK